MAVENLELWIAIAALWATQIKLLLEVREIKSVLIMSKTAKFKT